ncbi:MAG: enoyl-CoA hydratase/isomerase family protein [Minwuia sp.]|uniref:enoyl-CoA hydratase/isomerase family protein n=1 Tax=Minwuia sp. TaxID=2493630 RepID=UPI003A8AB03E
MKDGLFDRYETFNFHRKGRILTLEIDTGSPLNGVNERFHHELGSIFYDAKDDPDSDVIILTGKERQFCAGGDFAWFQDMIDRQDLWLKDVVPMAKRIISGLLEIEKPVICRLNGPAAGLGASIALLCDIIVASDNVKIGDPHVKAGLVAGDGGAIIWPQLIGFARAKEMLLTGKMLGAQEACDLGLINHVVPFEELDAKVDDLATELVEGATQAIRWTKTVMNLELLRIHAALTDAALGYETITNASHDHQEAVTAFRERRAPRFKGR